MMSKLNQIVWKILQKFEDLFSVKDNSEAYQMIYSSSSWVLFYL